MLELVHVRLLNPLYSNWSWFWNRSSYAKEQLEQVELIDTYVNDIIEKRRDAILSKPLNETNETEGTKEKPALLDILLQSEMDGKPLSNDDIRGEVNTFMFAGHETTGSTLSFLMYLLAKYPDIQKRLYTEIKSSGIMKNEEVLSMRSLNSLKLLDSVIKETLRLYPIFPMVPKKCIEDFKLGDIFIPANTFVGTTFSPNHLDEKYFKNAKEFIPDRWSDEVTIAERNPYVYQPFSAGLRNCIGMF